MKNVLITGGAGFIGFHTAIRFHSMGHKVKCIDNFNDVIYDQELKQARADKLEKEYGIEVFDVDIREKDDLKTHFEWHVPDLVIHLAAHAGVRTSMDKQYEYIQNNIAGTQNLIDMMEAHDVNQVIYASTSCIMEGNPLPWGPDEKVGKMLNPYGMSKLTNEHQFHISNIKSAVCLRFFTVYGPWGRPDMALFQFTKNILEDKPITVFNNGDMKRDFTYVDDIVQGIELVSQHEFERETFCIGYGEQVDLMDFISHIEKNLGNKEAEKIYKPRHPADALETWSDITKLRDMVGYQPTTSIADGVREFVSWYKEYYV